MAASTECRRMQIQCCEYNQHLTGKLTECTRLGTLEMRRSSGALEFGLATKLRFYHSVMSICFGLTPLPKPDRALGWIEDDGSLQHRTAYHAAI
mmetsp:Transcript_151573/g.267508  ORF Transcript_151573/g.267508 Transcript_151573/m.267508 type:complete len:94 (-) Transcript_151573:6-287(-)